MATSTSNTAAAQASIDQQNLYIRDTLMSIASNYANVLKDAVEGAFDSAEASTMAAVGKDLTRTFTRLAKMSDEFAHNQSRINSGLVKEKDITKQLQSLAEKRAELDRKMQHARLLGLQYSEEDYATALKSLDIQGEILKKDEKQLELIERRLGLTGKLVSGLNKVPFIGKFFNTEEIETKMRIVAAKGGGTFKTMGVAAGEIGKQLGKGLTDPLSLLTFFLGQALKSNKQVVELGKQLGKDSYTYRQNLASSARFNSNINITTENLVGAFNELVTASGLAYEYSVDQLATQVKLTKQVGLQADEAAQIQKFGVLNGKTSEETYNSFVKGLVATRNQLKIGINFKATLAEAVKVSGQLAANLGYNPERIAKAVVTAKAFGMTLEQVAKSGESLLNFESSLESELKAELLTGKQLNLERARAAALAGDQIALAEELAKNVGTAANFTKMNVLQQKSLAEAVGMTSDELANTLVKREQALASGKSLAQITEEEAKTALERQAVQEKFNQAILKLQDFFGNLIAGPFGTFLDMLSTSLGLITSIGAGLATWYVTSKLIAGSQLLIAWYSKQKLIADRMGVGVSNVMIGQLGKMLGISTAKAVAETTAATAISFGTLLPIILGAGAAIYGLISSFKGDDVMSEGGYVKRTLLSPEGAIKLNDKDTVIAGTDLGGGDGGGSMSSIDITPMVTAINEVKAAVKELMNRPVLIYLDSKQIGTSLVQNASYKSA